MKIGIDLTIFRSYQGTEVFTENLITALVGISNDHQLYIFKGATQFAELDKLAQSLPDRVEVVNFERLRNSVGVIITQQLLLPWYILRHGIKVVYSPSPFFSFLAPCHKINTIHDAAYKRYKEFRNVFSRLYIQLSFLLSPLCKVIVTVSDFSKQELVSCYGFDSDSLVVVGEALPKLPEVNSNMDSEVLAKFDLEKKQYLFYVGSLNPRKNIAGMIKSFAHYLIKYPDSSLKFVLAGNQNQDFANLQPLLDRLQLGKRIVFVGFISNQEKVVLLRQSVALFFASYYKGFGLPILEAQALGVPVITANTTSLPEVAGDAALLVDPHNLEEMVKAIHEVQQVDVADQLIARGKQNVLKFDWSNCAKTLLSELVK